MKPEPSAPAEVNPYESPAEVGGYNAAVAVVGAWRDGKLLVIHPKAKLPAFCIQMGQPAESFLHCSIPWHYPIDWNTRRLKIDVPFCKAGLQSYRFRRAMKVLITVAGACVYFATDVLTSIFPRALFSALFSLFIGGMIVSVMLQQRPLRFVRVRDPYLWFSGADRRFLAQLPPWMG
jgi:hypothetical protein